MSVRGIYRYHVPDEHKPGDPPPPLLLTVGESVEEVNDYSGRAYLCRMATLGFWLMREAL